MSMTALAAASLILAGTPPCPSGHTQAECNAIWAASHAVAATAGRNAARRESAAATAYLAAQDATYDPTILPPQARMKILYGATDLLSMATGTSVVVKKLVYFENGGLFCGSALFGARPQTFYLTSAGVKRGVTKQELSDVGCLRDGGMLIANY